MSIGPPKRQYAERKGINPDEARATIMRIYGRECNQQAVVAEIDPVVDETLRWANRPGAEPWRSDPNWGLTKQPAGRAGGLLTVNFYTMTPRAPRPRIASKLRIIPPPYVMNPIFCFRTFQTFPDPCTRLETTYYLTDSVRLKIDREYSHGKPTDRPVRTHYDVAIRHQPALQLMQQLAYVIDGSIERLTWPQLPRVAAHLLLMGP